MSDAVGLIVAAVALAVAVVALVASRRAALSAERWARRAEENAARAEALRRPAPGTVTTRPDGRQTIHLGDVAPGESRTIRVRPPR